MSILNTSISIGSTTLFPTPATLTKTLAAPVNGIHNGFQTISMSGSSATAVLYMSEMAAGNTGILYFYAEALATNQAAIEITMINGSNSTVENGIMRLYPGDIAFLPVYANDGSGITLTAYHTGAGDSVLQFFTGERG
jgi:hypothetical protein